MATTRRYMAKVTPAQVFDVLRDGRTYSGWVVGTRDIRDVDEGWPEPGTKLHFTVGVGRLTREDVTTAESYQPERRLELEARGWPAGSARIVLLAEQVEGGTLTSIDEFPLRGPAARLHNRVLDLLINLRNVETLRRLERTVRHR